LVDFFEPGAANENRRQNVRAAAPPAGSPSAEFLAAKEGGWSVKDVIRSGGTAAGRAKLGASAKDYLAGVKLTLGRSVELGSTLEAQRTDPASRKPCIKKKGGRVAFCIRAIDWPEEVRDYFLVSTVMYIGPKAVARFDEGSATRFYTLFETEVFDEVVDYFSRRFGPPTETLNRSIAPLAEPRQDNPTAIWRSVNPVTKQVTALEIRKFDDTRGGFPDRRHGAVLLYKKYSDPIFPTVSPLELMALRPNESG